VKVDLVRGLPRSEENHMTNGLALDEATGTLYLAQGGNTNHGAPSDNFALLPEYALAAAILSVDLDAIGDSTYDLPTLDDETRPGAVDANDPFGGNDGLNQARLVPGGPVQVYAPGFRNAYDLELATTGFYTIDNGGNAGWGGVPIGEGPGGTCTNEVNNGGPNLGDTLHRIGPGYYGGHPNPTRANPANTFNDSNPQSPVSAPNPIECDFRDNFSKGALTTFPTSTNGIDEFTAGNFGGSMTGDLVTASYNRSIYWIQMNSVGGVDEVTTLFSNVGGFPLDVVASTPTDPFPGTIWTGDFTNKDMIVFEPADYDGTPTPTCTGADSWALDEDGDGFANADEIDNGTDPCSAADVPPDADGDGLSDRNDPDDDNDGRPDLVDPFALDASDGADTLLPVQLTWDNDAPPAGGILGLGFTGSMINGTTDYLDTYDMAGMTIGGAAGVVTVDELTPGTARGAANDQDYGLQLGINASPATTGPFTVHSRLPAPFSTQAPEPGHRKGIQIGTGHQDHYLELVASGQDGGRVEAVLEVGGVPTVVGSTPLAMPGPEALDLFLTVDPATGAVVAAFEATAGGTTSPRTTVGTTVVPTSWMAPAGLAVGIIGTSGNASVPLTGSWSFLTIEPTDGTTPPASAWTTHAPLPSGREAVALSEVGGRLYLGGGGCQGPTCQGTHRRYDPATDSWQALPTIPQNLTHLQSAVVGDDIYYLGGLTEPFPGDEVTDVHVFDTATNTFSAATPMPAARARGAAGVVAHGGSVYILGGLRGGHDGVAAPQLDRYDPATGTWTALADLPRPRDHFQAAVLDGKIYAVGGRNTASGFLADLVPQIDVFDIATGTWSTLSTVLPTLRGGAGTVVVGDELVVVGGETPTSVIAAVEVLRPATQTWRTLAPMPVPRHGMQVAVLCGRIHVVGGSTAPTFQPTTLHQALDPVGGAGCPP
jgi:N-acetylneuraminic acid mutarotase